jgi:hypothetical protein
VTSASEDPNPETTLAPARFTNVYTRNSGATCPEQNPLKDAKIEIPWSEPFAASSRDSRMQRSAGNVCLTDRRWLGEAVLEEN